MYKGNLKELSCSRMWCWNWSGIFRRPAGSNYRKEFEQVVTEKMATKGYRFRRGKRDPTVYTSSKTGAMILHRFDDLRIGAAAADLDFLLSTKSLGEYQDMKVGKVEAPGTKVNVLGRTKVQTHDAFFTLPEPKHHDNILTLLDLWHAKPSRVARRKIPRTESSTQVVDQELAIKYPKCIGNVIGLNIDRRNITFEVRELDGTSMTYEGTPRSGLRKHSHTRTLLVVQTQLG